MITVKHSHGITETHATLADAMAALRRVYGAAVVTSANDLKEGRVLVWQDADSAEDDDGVRCVAYLTGSANALVSLNNGLTLLEESEIQDADLLNHWDALVNAMDDAKRAWVSAEFAPCSNREFLRKYVALPVGNLVIG